MDKNLVLSGPIPLDVMKKTPPLIELTVTATDNGEPPLSVNHTFFLPITNVQIFAAELPAISLDNQKVWEDSDIGHVIGHLYSVNQTVDDVIEFNLIYNQGNLFAIKENTYLILVGNLTEVEGTSATVTIEVRNMETFESATQNISIFIMRVNKCEVNGEKCDENARCLKSSNSSQHECICEIGFSGNGFVCEKIDYCRENQMPCENTGTCVNEVNKYVCLCPGNFVGEHCEIPDLSNTVKDPCSAISCHNGGVCMVNGEGRVVCSCPAGWQGELCESNVDDCVEVVCYDNGTCVDGHMDYVCECPPERTGSHCEYQPSLCQDDQACPNKRDVCIPLVDVGGAVCANESCVVDLVIREGTGVEEREVVDKTTQAVVQTVRQTGGLDRGRRQADRNKRQADPDLGVYVISITPRNDGQSWQVQLVVYEKDGTVLTQDFIYDRLNQVCSYSCKNFTVFLVLICLCLMLFVMSGCSDVECLFIVTTLGFFVWYFK